MAQSATLSVIAPVIKQLIAQGFAYSEHGIINVIYINAPHNNNSTGGADDGLGRLDTAES